MPFYVSLEIGKEIPNKQAVEHYITRLKTFDSFFVHENEEVWVIRADTNAMAVIAEEIRQRVLLGQ